ncbi:rod shape-determining protein RodA [Blattabacterium cuenoti]|uniref:rod shape-determining protein RodA n=1 Tax=Blattabacterium cuenoti TaxID=1653831 RepID=UPI00163C6C56|nr:rod shape-determining protein RodA [Blattabacterium cuenoti]
MIIRNKKFFGNVDTFIILIYFIIISFGYINLYSVSIEKAEKQLIWICISFICILIIFFIKPIYYQTFSPYFFLFTIILLIGVLFFGKNINGSKSWYVIGYINVQPAEFAKISTSLIIAYLLCKYNIQVHNNKKIWIYISLIILIPTILIFIQPDPGTAIVFISFILTLYREGLSILFIIYLLILMIIIFALSFNVSSYIILLFLLLIFIIILLIMKKYVLKNLLIYIFCIITFSICIFIFPFFYKNILKQHHKDRINILFQNEFDKQYRENVGYNLLYSKTSIGSGKLFGKGYKKGIITKGKFVPEQDTDYIFCTVGEEWGFVGSVILILLYLLFISRIYFLSEIQKSVFIRILGYSMGNIFLIHFVINIAMVMGIFPTIGIVLPFFSYGGSSFWSFTILLFIFIRLDASDKTYLI